jgi:hypothetical protein
MHKKADWQLKEEGFASSYPQANIEEPPQAERRTKK